MAGPKITHAVCASVDTHDLRALTILFHGNFERTQGSKKGWKVLNFLFSFFAKDFEA